MSPAVLLVRRWKLSRCAWRNASHTGSASTCCSHAATLLVELQEEPSPRSSVAGTQVGLPFVQSGATRAAASSMRSSASIRVKPMKALTFFSFSTATTADTHRQQRLRHVATHCSEVRRAAVSACTSSRR